MAEVVGFAMLTPTNDKTTRRRVCSFKCQIDLSTSLSDLDFAFDISFGNTSPFQVYIQVSIRHMDMHVLICINYKLKLTLQKTNMRLISCDVAVFSIGLDDLSYIGLRDVDGPEE